MDVVGTRNANKLTLNGGRIKDAANNDADLSHNAPRRNCNPRNRSVQ